MSFFQTKSKTALGIVMIGAVFGLGGCAELVGNPFSYESVLDAETQYQLLDDVATAAQPTSGADLPSSDTATYYGLSFIRGDEAVYTSATNPVVYYGLAEVTANFAGTGTVNGIANGFIDSDSNPADGQLTAASSAITRGPLSGFTATVYGTIQPQAGDLQDFTGMQIVGGFSGPNGEYLSGAGSETIIVGDGTTTESVDVDFTFVTRQ